MPNKDQSEDLRKGKGKKRVRSHFAYLSRDKIFKLSICYFARDVTKGSFKHSITFVFFGKLLFKIYLIL